MAGRPTLVGIVGDSGSGKTTLTNQIVAMVGAARALPLCLDDYHRYDRVARQRLGITALAPECNRLDLMLEHLHALRRGERIVKPVYDHSTGTFAPDEVTSPREMIVARGLLGLHTDALAHCYDISVFLDPDPELRIRWKIARDCAKRGYSPDAVRAQIAERRADAEHYVAPQRNRAELVISFYPTPAAPSDNGTESGTTTSTLRMRVIRRPSAPAELATLVLAAAERARQFRSDTPTVVDPFPRAAVDAINAPDAPATPRLEGGA